MRRRLAPALAGAALWAIAGCGQAAGQPPAEPSPKPAVAVVYAGSLAYLNDQVIGPAFSKATGIAYQGRGGGSFAMAHQIASGLIPADVFESIGLSPIQQLEPEKTRWAVEVASTPLVIAYNPHSQDAPLFEAVASGKRPLRDLFTFLASQPVRLGRTNPATDPQGQAFYLMVELATRLYHLPPDTVQRILGPWDNPHQVYSEEGLPTELQAGGLDLASAFLPEAVQRHLPYIPLPPQLNFSDPSLASWYATASLTIPKVGTVHGAPLAVWVTTIGNRPAGARFVAFLLRDRAALRAQGYPPLPPVVAGSANAIPQVVARALH
ncbi:MAG: substrate-binding domain-containing protein [Firmicutes bacterium]|nr:substrate-binding domain-containing protein [Alicyclobacillaceae bacterium]MCL6497812.1 substrate-binding domain-containing protein [Bacillota bacterium]